MKKVDLLNDAKFFKSFKLGEDLPSFFKQMHQHAIQITFRKVICSFGYQKHEKTTNCNSRNSFTNKEIKTSLDEYEIQVSGDRDTSFNPIIPKR